MPRKWYPLYEIIILFVIATKLRSVHCEHEIHMRLRRIRSLSLVFKIWHSCIETLQQQQQQQYTTRRSKSGFVH